jgi:hypothetical protein
MISDTSSDQTNAKDRTHRWNVLGHEGSSAPPDPQMATELLALMDRIGKDLCCEYLA